MEQLKTYPTIGVCGLDCGLCPRYHTVGASKCPGCGGPRFLEKHPSCSFITCGVKKRGLEACGQCAEFPCSKFRSEEENRKRESSSYPPDRKVLSNSRFIREKGIKAFVRQQGKRIHLLETMIVECDDGRSKSFFCRAAALLDPKTLKSSLDQAQTATGAGGGRISRTDRAKALRGLLAEAARREGIGLTARS